MQKGWELFLPHIMNVLPFLKTCLILGGLMDMDRKRYYLNSEMEWLFSADG